MQKILGILLRKADPRNAAGMAHFGISTRNALGVPMPILRATARKLHRDPVGDRHALALGLWRSGVHEVRILATLLADPARMDPIRIDRWLRQVDTWDLCDQMCLNLLRHEKGARLLVLRLSRRPETFVKRADFSLMTVLAVHDRIVGDGVFAQFWPPSNTKRATIGIS